MVLAPGVLRIADCSGEAGFAQVLGTPVKAWVPDLSWLLFTCQQCWRVKMFCFSIV